MGMKNTAAIEEYHADKRRAQQQEREEIEERSDDSDGDTRAEITSDSEFDSDDAAARSSHSDMDVEASTSDPTGHGVAQDEDAVPRNLDLERERETFSESSPNFLADSFTGGPRHLKALAKNALVVVSQMGPPSAFITLTCNAKDPAITCRLLPGQSAFDRPEIVVQVWRAQLGAFIHNLRHGKYLGGKVTYLMYVIEYQVISVRSSLTTEPTNGTYCFPLQHRGLPHAHIVCQIEGVPADREGKLAWIDKHIQARYPPPGTDPAPAYSELIMSHQIHHCSAAANGCLNAAGNLNLLHS
jgi:hypothetical protein